MLSEKDILCLDLVLSELRPGGMEGVVVHLAARLAERHREFFCWRRLVPVIANGVPAAAADDGARKGVRGELACSEESHLLLAVGNLLPERGFEDVPEAHDPGRLAGAMLEMMRNPEKQGALAAGESRAAKHYGIGRMVDQYLAWYERILNQG